MIFIHLGNAQCTSSSTSYDLTVSSNIAIAPSGPSYNAAIICSGGHLIDSANCCTRFIHIESGGIYESGPNAYAFVFIKSGGTFDAHGNSSFFGVNYEAGAIILNYSGPITLCGAVTFPAGSCSVTGISDQEIVSGVKAYPNPCVNLLHFETDFSKGALIMVYDIAGKKIMESFEIKNELNVSSLSPGMYSFVVTEGIKTSRGKFAIAR